MSADPCGCGCCAPAGGAAPLPVSNPPGLPAVGYRIGTYPSFREALVRKLSRSVPLRGLTARDDSDYAIAVLDGWAVIADILTFYSERTVNEAFLRTARLRDSVVRLAGLVGYDPDEGLAATAGLAFALEPATSFTIPAGTRIQSVPPPGTDGPPVKFETLADLEADAALNRVPLVAPPRSATPLAAGSTGGLFPPGSTPPAALRGGATLAAWSAGDGSVELKRAEAVTAAGPSGAVSWSPALRSGRDGLAVVARPLQAFGHDAPASFVTTYYDSSLSEMVAVEVQGGSDAVVNGATIPYTYSVGADAPIDLDGDVTDLRVGVDLLVASPSAGATARATVTAVTRSVARFGPTERPVTTITLSPGTPAFDRRSVQLLELAGDVELWDRDLPDEIDGATLYAALAEDDAPQAGRPVELVDATSAYEAAVVSAVPAPGLPGHLEIVVSPGPTSPLDAATAALLGNVVRGSHGETVAGELLGTGDASLPNQRFKVAKAPITRVPMPGAPHGGASTLVVRVDGVQWQEVPYLYGHDGGERVYVVEVEDDGSTYVRFGDGTLGVLLPTGSHVTADYRTGLGTKGNVGAGTLTSALSRPKGLKGVTNPLPAGGGGDPETLEDARLNAPATVRTFERIVSLRDAEDQARQNAMVGKATAAWTTVAGELGVLLTVAGAGGAQLGTTQLDDLRADLDARRDPNRPLVVRGYTPVALSVQVRLIAVDADRDPKTVQQAVAQALVDHFAFAARSFGQPVRLSEVYVAAQQVAGVIGVDVDLLSRRLHLLGADPTPDRLDLAPDELATLAASDVTVTVAS